MAKVIGTVAQEADLDEFSTEELKGEIARCRDMLVRAPNAYHRKYYVRRIHQLVKLVDRRT